jgi:MerR family redox-sensitive transcriptional activator SoxR
MAEFGIGEVAARSGLAASAIRYYESEGLIAKPARRNGRRVYDESILDELGLIELAKRAGFSVAEIRKLRGGFSRRTPPGERWRALTQTKLAEIEERIAEAEHMKRVLRVLARCECPTLADCARAMRSRAGRGRARATRAR